MRVPDPVISRSRKSAFTRVLRSLFAIALVIGVIAGGAVIFAYMQFTAKGPLAANTVYQVNQGSKRSIGAQLQDAGIVQQCRHLYGSRLCEGRFWQSPQGWRV